MTVPTYVVDTFTDGPFTGAPAHVVLLQEDRSEKWMRAVAAEMNHPETTFVNVETRSLRWFTAEFEVDMCGTGTLAAAHVLGGGTFETRRGVLSCEVNDGWIMMDCPAESPTTADVDTEIAFPGMPVQATLEGRSTTLVVVPDAYLVRQLTPDMGAIVGAGFRTVVVTAPADEPDVDFVSRWFGPGIGIPEVPVNGSSHCLLTPYWAKRLGRGELVARQVSSRPGLLRVVDRGDRVSIGGQAVTVMEGELLV